MAEKAHEAGKAFIMGEYKALNYTDCPSFMDTMITLTNNNTFNGHFFWDLMCSSCIASFDDGYAISTSDSTAIGFYTKFFREILSKSPSPYSPPAPSGSETIKTIIFIGDSITSGYNCGVNRKGMDMCSSKCPTTTCDSYQSCSFDQCNTFDNPILPPGSTFPNAPPGFSYWPNCSLSYLEFVGDLINFRICIR
jgi:hypothetical protein